MSANAYYTSSASQHQNPYLSSPPPQTAQYEEHSYSSHQNPSYTQYPASSHTPYSSNSANPSHNYLGDPGEEDTRYNYNAYNNNNNSIYPPSSAQVPLMANADPSNPSLHQTQSIPMKPTGRIQTNPMDPDHWQNQHTQYPPSPESQQAQHLLPQSRPKKKGFFAGRIPWVVYIVSLAQISVFVGEIVKNCEYIYQSQ